MPAAIECIDTGTVAIWLTALPAASDGQSRRMAEHEAAMRLLEAAAGPGTALAHRPWGEPYLPDHPGLHISLSHCRGMMALALSGRRVGVDIETLRTDQLQRVAPRFIASGENALWSASPLRLLAAWTLKEAMFKAIATGSPDLRALALPEPVAHTTAMLPFAGAQWHAVANGGMDMLTRCGRISADSAPVVMMLAVAVIP